MLYLLLIMKCLPIFNTLFDLSKSDILHFTVVIKYILFTDECVGGGGSVKTEGSFTICYQICFHITDVNECILFPDVCEGGGHCVNTEGSFTCRCPAGLALDSTGRKCIGNSFNILYIYIGSLIVYLAMYSKT